jgi:hypothetical protein
VIKMSGDESQTVRDDVLAAFEKYTQEPEVTADPEIEVKPEERDEKGRFAKNEAEAEPVETTEAVEPSEEIPEDEPQVEDKKPPQALAAHLKAKWSDIPPEIKNEFIRLEQASSKGVAKIQEEAKVGRSLMQEIEPYKSLIASAGGTPETAVRSLLQTAAILRTGTPAQKQNAVYSIIQEYGIQMGQMQQSQPDPYAEKIAQLEKQLQEQQQTRHQQEESVLLNTVNQFLVEADERGNPKYPLDENLEGEFGDEISAVRARNPNMAPREILEKAYERMSWKVPEIRQTLLERQQSETEAKRKEKTAQDVAKKQAAAVSIKGNTASGAVTSETSLRDLIAGQVYGTSGRV